LLLLLLLVCGMPEFMLFLISQLTNVLVWC
jgi:hypothetical protein